MKKVLFATITLLAISMGSANAQVVWGAKVGITFPTNAYTERFYDRYEDYRDNGFGVEAGPVLYYSLKNSFYLNSGALFSINTLKNQDDYYGDYTYRIYHLKVPLHAGYIIPLDASSLYVQAGPYAGLKMGGGDGSTIDAGLGVMFGININRFKIEAGYQHGLINIVNDLGETLSAFSIGVSYIF